MTKVEAPSLGDVIAAVLDLSPRPEPAGMSDDNEVVLIIPSADRTVVTLAIVTLGAPFVRPDSPDDLAGAIRRTMAAAVTDWVRTTQRGRLAYARCGGVFTLLTYTEHQRDAALRAALTARGIHGFSGKVARADVPNRDWQHDDNLVARLPGVPGEG
jgi:hypothetical protein